jgi:peptide/nickel transport system ATP-binding protein
VTDMHCAGEFVVEARAICKTYSQGRWWQKKSECLAVDNVSLAIRSGETLGLIGESGCGKTTLAMCLVGLERPDRGQVLVNGIEVQTNKSRRSAAHEIQMIFQDSSAALNPRMSALEIVEEPLLIRGQSNRAQRSELAKEMLDGVAISASWRNRTPGEFSGGQRQRIAIARALVLQPKVLILDEVFVGLDLSIQGQIANLLLDLQETQGLSYLCISHSLALVAHFADTIAVMDRGRIIETGSVELLCNRLAHPTTPNETRKALPQAAYSARSGA